VAAENREIIDGVFAGLASGLLDSCQGRGRLAAPNGGVVDVVVWVGPMGDGRPRSQVLVLANRSQAAVSDEGPWLFHGEVDASRLAVCVVGQDGRLSEISADADEVLGWDATQRGMAVHDAVHPEDASLLMLALGRSAADRRTVSVSLRMRGRTGQWTPVRCEVSPLGDDNPPRYAMAIRPSRTDEEPVGERASRLEGHLWRIAREVQAAGIGNRPGLGEAWWTDPSLAGLSERQTEILRRIVRGQRVPAIARELFITESTVRNHLSGIYQKLGVHSQSALMARLMPGNT
jgi:PAS domain S-box-containing protein